MGVRYTLAAVWDWFRSFSSTENCNSGIKVEPLAQLGPSLHIYFSPCSVIQGQKDEVTEEGERNEIMDLGGERPNHDFTPEKVTYIANISNSLKIEIQCLICK